jgi:type VI protein secretion system component VasK
VLLAATACIAVLLAATACIAVLLATTVFHAALFASNALIAVLLAATACIAVLLAATACIAVLLAATARMDSGLDRMRSKASRLSAACSQVCSCAPLIASSSRRADGPSKSASATDAAIL